VHLERDATSKIGVMQGEFSVHPNRTGVAGFDDIAVLELTSVNVIQPEIDL
jgi:hypothetical protein